MRSGDREEVKEEVMTIARAASIARTLGAAFDATALTAGEAAAAFQRFHTAYVYSHAVEAYLVHHGSLPGSERTRRLRKKRRTRVMKWWNTRHGTPWVMACVRDVRLH